MALLASQCRYGLLWSKLLPRTSLVLSQRIPDRNIAVRSKKFPEYSLIYDFDKVKTVSRINSLKYSATLYTGTIVPAMFILEQCTGYVSPNTVTTVAFFGCAITFFLHSCGILFNNVVGYIYLKDDDESVKLSYVGYWGQRVDIDTKIDNIQAFNDEPTRFTNPWYRRIRFNDSKKSFKLYHTAGNILDNKIFTCIFGSVD